MNYFIDDLQRLIKTKNDLLKDGRYTENDAIIKDINNKIAAR